METFGRYSLVKRLGAGGMGEVFLARTEGSAETLVVKRILPHLTANPRFLRLFLDETRIASRLVHPNIVRIHEYGEHEKNYFMIMEYVEGSNLREFLKIRKQLGGREALPLMIGLARGLQYSLDQGVTPEAAAVIMKLVPELKPVLQMVLDDQGGSEGTDSDDDDTSDDDNGAPVMPQRPRTRLAQV